MKNNYEFSKRVSEFIGNSTLEEIRIGCSDTEVLKIIKNDKVYYLKMSKLGILTKEVEKLKWLSGKLLVPTIILYEKTDSKEYLITKALNGKMLCDISYKTNPLKGIDIIVEAFKKLELVSITNCPFDESIDEKLKLARENILGGNIKLSIETLNKFKNVENVLKYLEDNKFYGDKCFSHGDVSLPNIFGDEDKFSGFIDVGYCGICDKWFDLAICEKSIKRNYGEEYIEMFYERLNIKPDRKKIEYYLLLMELMP